MRGAAHARRQDRPRAHPLHVGSARSRWSIHSPALQAPNSENFKAYLESLGLFDQRGRPKQAWRVFEREARALSERR